MFWELSSEEKKKLSHDSIFWFLSFFCFLLEGIFFIISNPSSSPQDLKNKLNYYSSYCSTKKLLKPCTFLRVEFLKNNCFFLFGYIFFSQQKQRQRSPWLVNPNGPLDKLSWWFGPCQTMFLNYKIIVSSLPGLLIYGRIRWKKYNYFYCYLKLFNLCHVYLCLLW